jgi:K+-transporting ATPase ATPase C chain
MGTTSMFRETVRAVGACAVTFLICAMAYPVVVWGIGQVVFPKEAEGSLIYARDRTVIGSELIAQPFASEKYFFSRPSAVDYKADATGGSNLGTKNPDLRQKVVERADALKATEKEPVPVDLVTASGGGVDPHISPEGANYQAVRVAKARKMSVEQVKSLIERHVERSGAIIGAPARVNVLKLNLALDEEKPATATPEPTAVEAARPEPGLAHDVETITGRVGEIAARVETLGTRLDDLTREESVVARNRADLKAVGDRIARLNEAAAALPRLSERVDGLDGRLNAVDGSVRQVQTELREARESLRALKRPAGR